MLNLFKFYSKEKKLDLITLNQKNNNSKESFVNNKHFPSSIREWNNSIYVYNNNALNAIPTSTNSSIKIIKGYFSLYNEDVDKKLRAKRLLLRLRRLSSNKIYISKGEFKHTNNKVHITIYVFNREKTNYLLTLKKRYIKTFLKKIKLKYKKKISFKKFLLQRLKVFDIKTIQTLKTVNNDKNIIKILNDKDKGEKYLGISEYIIKFYKKLLKKSLRKIEIYLYYKQLIYINRSKFNYTYLQFLKKYLEIIYNKNIEFNIVNLKRFYLNSDILSESISLKITRNRRKIIRFLNKLKIKVNTRNNKLISNKLNLINDFSKNKKLLKKYIINNLKYKHVTGFRLEAKGRLTRRYTASRSLSRLRYKGNLWDIDSSYKGLSTVLLKGNLKSNIQHTKLKSKSRIGSFGIKGWISGN